MSCCYQGSRVRPAATSARAARYTPMLIRNAGHPIQAQVGTNSEAEVLSQVSPG